MNPTLAAVTSGRDLLYSFGWLILAIAIFWALWKGIQLIKDPTLKTIAWVVWVVFLVFFLVDFFFGIVGIVSKPLIR